MYEDLTFMYGSGKYLMYLRKSRRDVEMESRGEAETLSRHLAILKELAKQMRINVCKIYAEVVSGESIDARPQMQMLLRDVESGEWDGVLVVEVERLARGDTSDQGRVAKTFKLSNTLIITPVKTYNPNDEFDESYFEFGLFMSRQEYKTIRRRLMAGSRQARMEGKFTGNLAPYGYEKYKLKGEKGFSLRIIPEQAEVVRMIYDWYVHGLHGEEVGYTKISHELNRLSIPSYSGGKWSSYSVQEILRNPVYGGYIKDGWRRQVKKIKNGQVTLSRPLNHDYDLYPGRHEAIINQEVFDMVFSKFRVRYQSPTTTKRSMQNPLCGLVICPNCGKTMVRRPYTGRKTPDQLICSTSGCGTVSSYLSTVENMVIHTVCEWLKDYELEAPGLISDNNSRIQVLRTTYETYCREIRETDEQISRQYDLLERGVYSDDVFLERNARMNRRKEELKQKLSGINEELQKEECRKEKIIHLIPTLRTIQDQYYDMGPADRNALLKEVIDHVIYHKSVAGNRGQTPDLSLEVFPKLP